MAVIPHINDADSGVSVRASLNTLIDQGICQNNIVVSLPAGETIGQYANGDTIPIQGKTFEEALNLLAVKDLPPVYSIATNVLTQTSVKGEVGAPYSNTLNALFTKNDAGPLTLLRIQKNGVDLVPSASGPSLILVDNDTYKNGNVAYIAKADYLPGPLKNYSPSGNPDNRLPLVRNLNAPQAAEGGFGSNTVLLSGRYKIFYGDSAVPPANTIDVRAAVSSRWVDDPNPFILNTGITHNIFWVAAPTFMNLQSVIDLTALNATITSSYVRTNFTVNDASGAPVPYNIYVMIIAGPYAVNHQHQIAF